MEVYGGGIKNSLYILKETSGSNYDPDLDNYTSWEYGWRVQRITTDIYPGHPIRAVAELPL